MKIVNCDNVREMVKNFKIKHPETLEEVFVWKYFNKNGQFDIPKTDLVVKNEKFLDTYIGYGFYDLGVIHAYPNTTTCISTGVKGEREEVTYQNIFKYYPRLCAGQMFSVCENMESGKISDICTKFKENFKSITGEDFTAMSDDGLVSQLIWKFEHLNALNKVNEPELKLKITGDDFVCFLDYSNVIDIPTGVSLTYHQMKQEKEALENYPNKYLSKKVLGFAVSKFIINTWEYKFYLDILSKPKPRKLSQRQANMYKTINSKIRRAL